MRLSLAVQQQIEQTKKITTLSSIVDNHLVLNCRCGHVGQIAVSDLIEVHGGDVSVDAIERAARCRGFRTKSITSMQIIYVGSSEIALLGCEIKQSGDNLDDI